MKSRIILYVTFCFPLIITGCSLDNEQESELFSIVSTSDWKSNAGDLVLFDITAVSKNTELQSLKIDSFDPFYGGQTLKDYPLTGNSQKIRYEYRAPFSTRDTLNVTLHFTVSDANGNSSTSTFIFKSIASDEKLIVQRGSFILQSPFTREKDAFDLKSLSVCNSSDKNENPDIVFRYYADGSPDCLPRSWTSSTDIVFQKWNSFNYPNATDKSIINAISCSIMTESVQDIEPSDIILIGKRIISEDSMNSSVYPIGVILIEDVIDNPSYENDRIIFQSKVI